MNPFDLLKADHQKVAELFDLLETAGGKRKLDVFARIKNELEVHTHIEEAIFYPALEKPEATHDLTLEAYEEHNLVKQLLSELSGARSATDEWQAKAKVLRENVEHHVEEEENELFDKADDALTDEELEALGDRMAAEKARKLGQPAPKESKPNKSSDEGIISKIKNLVGLGEKQKPAKRKAAKKAPAKKKAATKTSARKRASASAGSKRSAGAKSAGSKSGSKKQKAAKSRKKTK